MKKTIIISICFTIILIIGIVVLYYPYIPLFCVAKIHFLKDKERILYVTPIDKQLARPDQLEVPTKNKFTCNRLMLSTPWSINLIKKYETETGFSVRFEKNETFKGFIVICDKFYNIDYKKGFIEAKKRYPKFLSNSTTDYLESNYTFLDKCLSSTPDRMKLFCNKEILVNTIVLMTLKPALVLNKIPIYRIKDKQLKGFQFGDPLNNTDVIKVILFDEYDYRYEISFVKVTQNELDYILSTVQFVHTQRTRGTVIRE